jgi:uncharacterized protein
MRVYYRVSGNIATAFGFVLVIRPRCGYSETRMLPLIEQHRTELDALCRRYEVRRLELFGSGARGDFDLGASDLDFLVAFTRPGKLSPADRFFGLLADLEDLFGCKVDIVDVSAHRNPYFMAEALKHREMLYAA